MAIKLGIALTTFNSEDYIHDSLKYVLSQSVPFDQILVVDDYSSDKTLLIAKNVLSKSSVPYRIIQNKKNYGGPAHSRNLALQESFCDYIAFLDADDCCLVNRSESIKKYLLTGRPDCLINGIYEVSKTNFAKKPFLFALNVFNPYHSHSPTTAWQFVASPYLSPGSSLVIKKSIFPEIKFNESSQIIAGEDKDFIAQALLKRKKITSLPGPLVIYNYFDWKNSILQSSNHISSPFKTLNIISYFIDIYSLDPTTPSVYLTFSRCLAYFRLNQANKALASLYKYGFIFFLKLCLFSVVHLSRSVFSFFTKYFLYNGKDLSKLLSSIAFLFFFCLVS